VRRDHQRHKLPHRHLVLEDGRDADAGLAQRGAELADNARHVEGVKRR